MGLTDIFGETGADVLGAGMLSAQVAAQAVYAGRLPKAMLFTRRLDEGGAKAILDTVGIKAQNDVMALRALIKGSSGSKGLMSKAASKAGQVSGTGADLIAETAKVKTTGAALMAELKAKDFNAMVVQYNPSSIRLNSSGGYYYDYDGAGDKALSKVTSGQKPSTVYFSVTLIFEEINDQDAFGYQDMSLNIGTGIESVKSIYTNLKGEGYSVRPQVESLVALLMHRRTQQVIFYWADMFFHGELTNVDATYTMFNKKGHPIRAEVQLRIQQADSNSMFTSDIKAWDAAFDAAFPG